MKSAARTIIVLLVITIALATIYWLIISYYSDKNRTDDAHVDGDIVPVLARTDGFTETIYVDDDEHVNKGDTLVQLDTTDYHLQLLQAITSLAISKTNLERSMIALESKKIDQKIAEQQIGMQEASLVTAESNYRRNGILKDKGVVSVQIYEFSEEAYKKAILSLENAQDRLQQATAALENAYRDTELAQYNIAAQENQIKILKQNILYSSILAPVTGYVSKRSVQTGQMVRTGTQIFSIVQSDDIWVTANFKETQLAQFPVGTKVKMVADAYPKENFIGIVESIGAATGSKFALLPPDNATGNYVKVIQRVPVKIQFEDKAKAAELLRPGFSIVVSQ